MAKYLRSDEDIRKIRTKKELEEYGHEEKRL